MSDASSPLANLIATTDVKGNPVAPGERIPNAQQAYSVYYAMRLGDRQSALNRARMRLVLEGFPPYDPEMLRATGQEGIANINTGIMKTYMQEACMPLLDQLNTQEKYINIALTMKKDEERDWEDEISVAEDEHYTMLKNDPNFNYRKIELVRQMVAYGISVPYFSDGFDWRWRSEPIGEFLIPHMTPANEEQVEVACMVRSRQPHELAKYLDGGNEHWNRKAIKEALRNAKPRTLKQDDWERMQDMWKGNDLWMTSQCDEVTTVDMWVTEMDGTVTHLIFTEDGQANEFLYKCVSKFQSRSQAYQFFTFDIATNGFYHSIRGLGFEALPIVQEINRIFSAFMDAVRLQSKLGIQPKNEDALQNMTFLEHSGFFVIPSGVDIPQVPTVNFGQSLLPSLDYLSSFLNRKMSHYASDATFSDYKRRTKAEVMAKVQQLASLGEGNTDLLNQSWEKLVREQFRRIVRPGGPDWTDVEPGGKQALDYFQRCKERGVSDEFWKRIDIERCTAEKAVGAGSAAQQIMTMERLMEFFDHGFFDADGEFSFKKDATRLFTNKEKADRYVGKRDTKRPTQDEKNAVLENKAMDGGKPTPVFDNDNHTVHATVHLGISNPNSPTSSLADDVNVLESALQQGDENTILQVVPSMIVKHGHTAEHIEKMREAPKAAEYRQKLQQLGGLIENAQKKMIHIQEQRAEQARQAQGGEGQDAAAKGDFNLERQIVEAQFKLRSKEELHQQEKAHKEENARQDMEIKDREAEQKMAIEHAQKTASYATDLS
jgi:hypothetical protein